MQWIACHNCIYDDIIHIIVSTNCDHTFVLAGTVLY